MVSINIQKAGNGHMEQLNQLLFEEGLPTIKEIRPGDQYWVVCEQEKVVAGIGLERYAESGLLRSLVTDANWRNRGMAGSLVETLENRAKEQGLAGIFLLTETARDWFSQRGYGEINREEAPGPISLSDEFASLCPASATLMKKKL